MGGVPGDLTPQLQKDIDAWVQNNPGALETAARDVCTKLPCKQKHLQCRLVDFKFETFVDCFNDLGCESGVASQPVISISARCRCIPKECATANLHMEFEEIDCTGESFQQSCQNAGQKLQERLNKMADRVCEQQPCPAPPNPPGTKCKASKTQFAGPAKVEQDKNNPNCCKVTVKVTKVQCKC